MGSKIISEIVASVPTYYACANPTRSTCMVGLIDAMS